MRYAVIGILVALLAGAIYVGHYGWVSAGHVTMPAWGWLMMGLGIFFTLVVGGGLMGLIFYSSRAASPRTSSTTRRLKTPDEALRHRFSSPGGRV